MAVVLPFIILLSFRILHSYEAKEFCIGKSNGLYPFKEDLEKYIICADEDTFLRACPGGLIFDEGKSHCNYRENVMSNLMHGLCGNILHHDPNRKDMRTGVAVPHGWTLCFIDQDDTKYHNTLCKDLLVNVAGLLKTSVDLIREGGNFGCWHGTSGSRKGPSYATNGVIFHGCRNNVQHITKLSAWDVSTTTLGVCIKIPHKLIQERRGFCQGKRNGIYSYRGNCSKFITCANNDMFIMDCPQHLLFDEQKRHCNYEWNITRLNCTQDTQSDTVLGKHNIGEWGSKFICPNNGFINGFRLKSGENTALNGIQVSCTSGENSTSFETPHGKWRSSQKCSDEQHAWAFNFRSQKYLEGGGDNIGGYDVIMVCTDNVKLLGGGNEYGSWACTGAYCSCNHRDATLCGIQTKVDESSITRINFICCRRQ